MADTERDRAELLDPNEQLHNVCGETYQFAGAMSEPDRVLDDNLAAAADGRPLPHRTFLPVSADECNPLPRRARS